MSPGDIENSKSQTVEKIMDLAPVDTVDKDS